MVSTLSQKTAQKLVNTVKDVCGQDINFINSNFAYRFCLCTLKIQYLAVIQLS